MLIIRWRTVRVAWLRVCMKQTSNSLLGKAVRSRRALHVVGNALLQEDRAIKNASAASHQGHTVIEPAAGPLKPAFHEPQSHLQRPHTMSTSDEWVPLLDPRKLFQAIINAKKTIGLLSLAGLVLGILFAMSTPKYYYSTAEILIDPRDLQISDRELLPTGLPYDASLALVENQTRILTSRRVISGTVEQLNLDQDAEFNGKGLGVPGPAKTLLAIIFGQDSDDSSKAKELAVENLLRFTGVSRTPKTFVISLTVQSESPEKAALIANTMAEVYMNVQDEIQSDTVGRANSEIGGRLEELRTDVEKAERLVEAYRSENELFDANGKLISDDEISLTSTQLTRAREKVAEFRARADSARELTLDAVLSDALPEGASSNLIAELRRGYAGKVQQRDALSEKLGAQHPQLRTAEAEVASARRGIEAELRRLSQTTQIELQRAVKTEQDLAAGQARLKSQKSAISESLVRLRELEREAAARRSVYESFLLRARETGQQAGISTANTTIVSQAVPALRPYGTSRKLVAAGGLVAGFMLGVFFALMGELWRSLTYVARGDNASLYQTVLPADRIDGLVPPNSPTPPGGGSRAQEPNTTMPDVGHTNHNPKLNANQGDPMYYPFPVAQPGMIMAPAQQPMMQPQMMAQTMMQPSPYGYPMMQPQPMPHYPYGQPQMTPQPMMQPQMMQPQMMQPQMIQPQMIQPQMLHPQIMQPQMMQPQMMQPQMMQPVVQPVYIAMPQQATPVYQPPSVAQGAPDSQTAPTQNDAQYSEIRNRLRSLRDGIVNLADGRERLSKLG